MKRAVRLGVIACVAGGMGIAWSCAQPAPSPYAQYSATGGGAATGPCSVDQTLCGESCVDLSTSTANCGECSNACSVGQRCEDGACQCLSDLTLCAGSCVDTSSNAAHCGGCDVTCPAGQVCSQGSCAVGCGAGLAQCGTSCVDLLSNPYHCGGCDQQCPAGQNCSAGACSCAPGQTACNGLCVDILSNVQHCGACGNACGVGQLCQQGHCVCPSGQQYCANVDSCVDIRADAANCGSCGNVCPAGGSCVAGLCTGTAASGGTSGTGGAPATQGTGGSPATATGGTGTGGDVATGGTPGTGGAAACPTSEDETFSFFLISHEAVQRESGSADGFGGDLGGLDGADAICLAVAEYVVPCAVDREWRAFLSTTTADAIDRIGDGPWYDRVGRLLANNISELVTDGTQDVRMLTNADPEIRDDLPNEFGIPNLNPDGTGEVDNHQTLTGSGMDGRLYNQAATTGRGVFGGSACGIDNQQWSAEAATCWNWTSAEPEGCPRVGHSWPRDISGINWISVWNEGGCAPGGSLEWDGNNPEGFDGTARVGSAGGYGGWYCFAILP